MSALCALDLDGTLVDTLGDIHFHANVALQHVGLPSTSTQRVRECVGKGALELMRGLVGAEHPRLSDAVTCYEQSYERDPAGRSQLFPGALDALKALRDAGIAAAVVTNKQRHISIAVLKALDVDRHLIAIEGAVDGIPHKPNAALLRRAAEAANASPREVVMIGDSLVDVLTAEAFGCGFSGVRHGMDEGRAIMERGLTAWGSLGEAVHDAMSQLGHG